MLILDRQGNEIARRCLAHYAIRCMELECVEDEIDFRTNPARRRPKATVGAPEVSWGLNGVVASAPPTPAPKPSSKSSSKAPARIPAPRPSSVISSGLLPMGQFLK